MGRAELDLLDLATLQQPSTAASPPEHRRLVEEKPKRSRFAKALLIVLGCFLTVVLGAAGIFFRTCQPWESKQIPGAANTRSSPFLALDEFMINLKDDSGKNMILLCDLTLEAADPGRLSADQKTDLRRTVYRKFKQRRAEQVRFPKFKKEFAGELKTELNGMYGESFITNVYITRFVIL